MILLFRSNRITYYYVKWVIICILKGMANNMLIMHGSTSQVSNPEIRVSKFYKDFGDGFYCTSIEAQAFRWASRFGVGVINYYNYNPESDLRIMSFPKMTEDWLDFIADCRAGGTHDYDIVEGPMANDEVYNFVADFLSGSISRVAFWELVKFRYPTHQICFHTENALESITFVSARAVN